MEEIRGLTIKFDADTNSFTKEMKNFNKELSSTTKQSKSLQESLKFEWNPDKFKKAQQLAQKAITDTSYKADTLRKRLKEMEDTGVKTDKQVLEYKKWQAELEKTETRIEYLQRDLEKLDKMKLDNLVKSVDKVGQGFSKAGRALAPVSAAAGAVVAGLGAAGLNAVKVADDIATTATQLGMSAEALQRYQYIAMQTDVSNEQLQKGFRKLREGVGQALTGQTNKATQALENLGFSMSDLESMSNEQIFDLTVEKLSQMEDSTMQAHYANEIFSERVANDMIPLLKTSAETMGQLNAEYEASGALTNEQVAKLAEFDNVMNRIKTTIANQVQQIGFQMLPVMEAIADVIENKVVPKIQKFVEILDGLTDGQKKMMVAALGIITALAPVLLIVGKLTSVVGGMIPMISKLNIAMKGLLGPIGIILAVFALLYSTNEKFREAINNLIQTLMSALMPIVDLLMDVFNQLLAVLMPVIDMFGVVLADVINALVPIIASLIAMLMPLIQDVLAVMLPMLTQNVGMFAMMAKTLLPLVTLLLDMAMVLIKMLMPVLGFLINILARNMEIMAKMITWVMKLQQSFLGFILKVLDPIIKKLGQLWDWLKKILGLDEKKQIDVGVNYSDPGFKPDDTTSSVNTNDMLKNTVSANQGTLSNIKNTTNNIDNSNRNVTVNLTLNNYGDEIDENDLVERINLELAKSF